MKSGLFCFIWPSGRTRTSDQVVTGDPMISRGPGLSHHPRPDSLGRRALLEFIGQASSFPVSAPSCLLMRNLFSRLGSGLPYPYPDVGFPEFTRCFNDSFPSKLRCSQPPALPTELPGNTMICSLDTKTPQPDSNQRPSGYR